VGNGVADDKLTYTYVPEMIRYYLGEDPILPNVETYRLEDPDQLAYVLDHLDRLVLKPVSGSGGYGILIGPQASDEELAEARVAVATEPRAWIAQELVPLSTAPTSSDNHLAPRHLDLRPFAVNDGQQVWVMPGGLTRVALPKAASSSTPARAGVPRTPGSRSTITVRLGTGSPSRSPPAPSAPRSSGRVSARAAGSRAAGPNLVPAWRTSINSSSTQQQQQQGGATC
jgi:hypothetical protein